MLETTAQREQAIRDFVHKYEGDRCHYNVAPRYSPGSPAMVDHRTAIAVAESEARIFVDAKNGFWGEEESEKAEREGLKGIVEFRQEYRSGWRVLDLLTGDVSLVGQDPIRVHAFFANLDRKIRSLTKGIDSEIELIDDSDRQEAAQQIRDLLAQAGTIAAGWVD